MKVGSGGRPTEDSYTHVVLLGRGSVTVRFVPSRFGGAVYRREIS